MVYSSTEPRNARDVGTNSRNPTYRPPLFVRDGSSYHELSRNEARHVIERYYGRPKWKRNFSKFMIGYAAVANVWLLIQVIQLYDKNEVDGISVVAFSIYVVNAIVWFLYGLLGFEQRDIGLMVSGSIAFTLGILTLVAVGLYKDNGDDASPTIPSL